MYKLVKRILDKSREKNVDVLVAADMVAVDGAGHTEELNKAKAVIDKYYDTITKLRREKDEATIEKLCAFVEAGDTSEIRKLVDEVEKR